jgi:hypothetical protein
MKKLIFVLVIFILILPIAFSSCTRTGSSMNGSGKIIDQDLKLAYFNTIDVHGTFELEIVQGASYEVTLSTDENLINRVHASLERKSLMLSIEAPATFFPTVLKVKITMPGLAGINLSEGAHAAVSGFQSSADVNLFLNKGSILNGALEADNITINLSGTSQANLVGKASSLDLQCSANSKIDLSGFSVTQAQVKLKEASEAILNVSAEMDVNLSDASKVFYLGNPLIADTYISGGSTMIRK